MFTHFLALIIGQALAHRLRFVIQDTTETFKSRGRRGIFHPHQHHQPARSLNQGSHRRLVERTFDEIPFPVPLDQLVFHLGWANMKDHHVLNLAPSILTACSRAPDVSGLSQATQQLRSQFPLGHHIQSVVDRFVRHPLLQFIRLTITECASDLLRKTNDHGENTPPRQTVTYEDPAWAIVAFGAASPELALLRSPPHNSTYQDNAFSILD